MNRNSGTDNLLLLSWSNYDSAVTTAFNKYLASQDVKYTDLEYLVRFIYSGEVVVPRDQVQDVLNTGELLQIKGLTEKSDRSKDELKRENQTVNNNREKKSDKETVTSPKFESVEKQNSGSEKDSEEVEKMVSERDLASEKLKGKTNSNPTEKNSVPGVRSQPERIIECSGTSDDSLKIARKSSPTEPGTKSSLVGQSTAEPSPKPDDKIVSPKPKKRRIYENSAPVYDNRQIYAADLLQTQLDYSGDDIVLENDEDGFQGYERLSPVSGVEDCGPFKKIWSNTYIVYNLGKEIICLLCFCRFTQFKKFNLERHMRKKHPDYYQLDHEVKKKVLDVLVGRYEEMVTPGVVASVPCQGNESMVSDILQMDSIEWSSILGEDLGSRREEDLKPGEEPGIDQDLGIGDKFDDSLLECQIKLQCEDGEIGYL
ncbi:longitudinals lacking protein, isoforms H/M/V isoform X2 [Eurytemora carolleeae]|uniref:longitudinals lacking protein, isoforms H/M/V isoform X2 n=1 Tax=Eurytemora carolleeae TaxID=1294199 RepID=UPI000C794226|nr:longitudinals lacking protein, isoforms H/M/V isoform X2 [Eurytemora carolleeae]|eukprot:XP_023328816.1 longitudinals lacking protein, isoforms H/M/V-like isoform X2 [Eurytemora affinis]